MCARHIYAVWAKKWRGDDRQSAFWHVAKSTFKAQLTSNMGNVEKFGSTSVDNMLHYPLHQWCKVFFTTKSCYDVVDNNMAEKFNG